MAVNFLEALKNTQKKQSKIKNNQNDPYLKNNLLARILNLINLQ